MSEATMPKQEQASQPVEIERAVPDDAEVICDIRDRAWIDAYPNPELGITAQDIEINAKGLHGEFVPRRIAYLKEKLATPDRPDGATFVAKINGKVVGFVDPSIEDGKRRIGAIYVAPEAQGTGIGGKLMQQALYWHGRNEDIYLEVVAYNQNAIGFYKRFGFEQTDTVVPEEPNRPDFMKSLPQIEMVLKAETKERHSNKEKATDWQLVQEQIESIRSVEGGFSQAKRGLITMSDGREVFVKVGLQENTKKWAKKEVGVYRFLEKHHYPHAPRLLAVNDDETAFALEAFTPNDGWNWQETWNKERLYATLQAMDDLAAIELGNDEREFFSEQNISQDDNGWLPLLASPEKQEILRRKLHGIAAEDIANAVNYQSEADRSSHYEFATDTLVHYDIRTDNCAWNAAKQQVRIVDWNWTQLGDSDIELAATLTHVQKSGFDLPTELRSRLKPDALHWMAGFWFNAAATPIWEGGPEHLRDFQLLAGVTALRLAQKV